MIVALPETTLQTPVPVVGLFPANVKLPVQFVMSEPALEVVGKASFLIITSSKDDVHVPLVIVQRNVALVPAVTPVTVVVAEDAVVIVAVPDIKLQDPVPVVGVFAAIVNVPLLHCVISTPAFETVGTEETIIVPVTTCPAQLPPIKGIL